ncbi:HotDog domain-containing protein [Globomyces pollinis-pini]|nr:HotDog domain-containing protein [Globomyces pollinis-pini]
MQQTIIEQTLELEELDTGLLYRSKKLWKPTGFRAVFGGQVIGLALGAAMKTVESKYLVHSLHCYFLLPGDDSIQIVYKVDSMRTGRTYATRNVTAFQRGKVIFAMMVSYAVPEITHLRFQIQMPVVPGPNELTSDEDRLRSLLLDPRASKFHKTIELRLQQPIAIETKVVPITECNPPGEIPNKYFIWMKAKGTLPESMSVHQCVAAYCSDHQLLNTALVPFGLASRVGKKKVQVSLMTSLDHAIWFHEPFRADEWLLYQMESDKSVSGRGFTLGKVWTQDGKLVMSLAQQGVIRAKTENDKEVPLTKL